MNHVFLSFAAEDIDAAQRVFQHLHSRGVSVGPEASAALSADQRLALLATAKWVIVLMSRHALNSESVLAEAERAAGLGTAVLVELEALAQTEIPAALQRAPAVPLVNLPDLLERVVASPEGISADRGGHAFHVSDPVVKGLIARGRLRGFITYDELNAQLPPEEFSFEQIENLLAMFAELDIEIVENEEGGSAETSHGGGEEVGPAPGSLHQHVSGGRQDDPVRMFLREMGDVPSLSREAELELIDKVRNGGEVGRQAKRELVEAKLRLVNTIAKKYVGQDVQYLDLIQAGNEGLIEAVDEFETDSGISFSDYASGLIEQSVRRLTAQPRSVRIPAHMLGSIKRVVEMSRQITRETGRAPTLEELSTKLHMPLQKLRKLSEIAERPISPETPIDKEAVTILAALREAPDDILAAIQSTGEGLEEHVSNKSEAEQFSTGGNHAGKDVAERQQVTAGTTTQKGRSRRPKERRLRALWSLKPRIVDLFERLRLGKKADLVDCSIYAPRTIRPGASILVQVFLHIPEQVERVQFAATLMDASAASRGVKTLETEITRGTRVGVVLDARGLNVDEPEQSIIWRGEPQFCQFVVKIPQSETGEKFFLTARISVGGAPVGCIKFSLRTGYEDEPQKMEPRGESVRRYSHAFLSYASADRKEVLKRAQVLEAAGISYFHDLLTLDPGVRWEREIYKNIDRCDLFLLFWSSAARNSEWVVKEAEYALSRKGDGDMPDIVPVILETPAPKPPAGNLTSLHFNDRIHYLIAAQ